MDNETYFNRIYDDTYLEILKFVIIKTSYADQVDDIIQNTYHHFYKRILRKGFKDIKFPKAFIIRLAERELFKHYKGKALKKDMEIDLDAYDAQIETDESSFAENIEVKDILNIVHNIAVHMPLLSYKSFILFYYYDLSIAGIAHQLDISEQNVKNRLWRTRNSVRKALKGDYYDK